MPETTSTPFDPQRKARIERFENTMRELMSELTLSIKHGFEADDENAKTDLKWYEESKQTQHAPGGMKFYVTDKEGNVLNVAKAELGVPKLDTNPTLKEVIEGGKQFTQKLIDPDIEPDSSAYDMIVVFEGKDEKGANNARDIFQARLAAVSNKATITSPAANKQTGKVVHISMNEVLSAVMSQAVPNTSQSFAMGRPTMQDVMQGNPEKAEAIDKVNDQLELVLESTKKARASIKAGRTVSAVGHDTIMNKVSTGLSLVGVASTGEFGGDVIEALQSIGDAPDWKPAAMAVAGTALVGAVKLSLNKLQKITEGFGDRPSISIPHAMANTDELGITGRIAMFIGKGIGKSTEAKVVNNMNSENAHHQGKTGECGIEALSHFLPAELIKPKGRER